MLTAEFTRGHLLTIATQPRNAPAAARGASDTRCGWLLEGAHDAQTPPHARSVAPAAQSAWVLDATSSSVRACSPEWMPTAHSPS